MNASSTFIMIKWIGHITLLTPTCVSISQERICQSTNANLSTKMGHCCLEGSAGTMQEVTAAASHQASNWRPAVTSSLRLWVRKNISKSKIFAEFQKELLYYTISTRKTQITGFRKSNFYLGYLLERFEGFRKLYPIIKVKEVLRPKNIMFFMCETRLY